MTQQSALGSIRAVHGRTEWVLMLLFVASAVASVWVAYDHEAAFGKLLLVGIGLAVGLVFAFFPEHVRVGSSYELPALRIALCVLPAAVAAYFLLTNDWLGRIGKMPLLDPVMHWFARWQPAPAVYRLDSNAAGGVIASLLPLQVAALKQSPVSQNKSIGITLLLLSGVGLLLSASRGAWFAVGFVSLSWVLWRLVRTVHRRPAYAWLQARVSPAAIFVLVSLVGALALALTPLGEYLLALRSDRVAIWQNSFDVLSDYRFTGVGLGNFEMAYSSYTMLVHTGYATHANNLYLDLWLEQGLLGLLTFGAIAAVAVLRPRPPRWWGLAAAGSMAILLLHGCVDDAFYGYGGRALPFLLLPFALRLRPFKGNADAVLKRPVVSCPWFPVVVLGASLTLSAIAIPAVRAVFLANAGAVSQGKAELSVYRWPQWPMQDVVRRLRATSLADAISDYQGALALDRTNATANRRLGQIELALGEYDAACRHLSAAYAALPNQRATRQLVGECYALNGDVNKAAALWHTLDLNSGQLAVRTWWYADYLGDEIRSRKLTSAIALLGHP